jgi:hypothetical protein
MPATTGVAVVAIGVLLALWLALLLPYKGSAAPAPIKQITQQLNSAFTNTANSSGGAGRLLFL